MQLFVLHLKLMNQLIHLLPVLGLYLTHTGAHGAAGL